MSTSQKLLKEIRMLGDLINTRQFQILNLISFEIMARRLDNADCLQIVTKTSTRNVVTSGPRFLF